MSNVNTVIIGVLFSYNIALYMYYSLQDGQYYTIFIIYKAEIVRKIFVDDT